MTNEEMKNQSNDNIEVLEKINEFIEENGLYSEVRRVKDGEYILLLADVSEEQKIEEFLAETYDEDMPMPCDVHFSDEVLICECCHKVVEQQPTSAFWSPSFVINDGEVYCNDCLDVDALVEEKLNDDEKCIYYTQVSKEELLNREFVLYEFNGEDSFEANSRAYDNALEKAKEEYNEVLLYVIGLTPFEFDVVILVRNKK